MSPRLANFCDFFTRFNLSNLDRLESVYADSVLFKDPVHELTGVADMRGYLAGLCAELEFCNFVFHRHIEQGDSAYLRWSMEYAHPKIAGGKPLQIEGASEIEFDGDLVKYQCDYYDMGAMLYEHLPIIGAMIRWLRNRLAQS